MQRVKKPLALLFVIAGFAYLAGTLAYYSPAGRHWRYARMRLPDQIQAQERYVDDPLFLYHLSRKLNAQGQFADALPFAERAVGLNPDDANARDEWAKAMLGTGQATQAYAQLKQYLAAHPRSPDAHFFVARYFVTQDKILQAQKLLEETVALDPDYTRAWAILGPIYIKQGSKKLAQSALEKTLLLDPDQAQSHLQLAVMLASDSRDRAQTEFERAITLAPDDLNCREQYARFLLSNQDFGRAETQARKAVALNAGAFAPNALLGQCLTMANRYADALPFLNAAISLDPHDPTVAQNLMTAYSRLGNREQAHRWQAQYARSAHDAQQQRDLESTVRIHPDDRQAQRGLAALFAGRGEVNSCLLHHAAAEKAQPDSPRVLLAAARDLDKAGYNADALMLIRRITQRGSNNVEAIETKADILLHLGRVHEAAIHYELLRDSQADRKARYRQSIADASARLANSAAPAELLLRQAQAEPDPRKAEPILLKARELDPENTRILRLLLRVQWGQGEREAAQDTARRLSAISPEDGLSQTLLSVLLLEAAPTGSLDEGLRQEVETRLANAENDPSTLPALFYAYGLLFLKEGKVKEAVHDLAQSVRLAPDSPAAYQKLAEAKQMAGDPAGARQALADFQARVAPRDPSLNK